MKKRRSGFTLIELLVAIGVTAVLITLILNITVNVLNTWNRSTGILTAANQARVILDQIDQDIQSIRWRSDVPNAKWLLATVQGDSAISHMTNEDWGGTTKPSGAASLDLGPAFTSGKTFSDARYGQKGLWLRMLATVPGPNSGVSTLSAPRAVSYQLVRRAQSSATNASPVYQMYRAEVGVAETFGAGYDLADTTAYPQTGSPSGENDPKVLRTPIATQLIGNDVVDFGIRFYNSGGGVIFPKALTDRNFAGAASAAGYDVVAIPAAAEVFVRILTSEGVRKLAAFEAGNLGGNPNWWDDIVIPNSTVYTRRIAIRSASF